VLCEERHFLAVDKPAGATTQPSAGRVGESLVDAVSVRLGRPAGLVHRLDRDTSGVVLFGKDGPGTSALAALFRRGEVQKRYLAVTGPGLPAGGEIDLPLSKDPKRLGRFRASRAAHGVPAVTGYARLHDGAYCLVRLEPRTGRTHQLRAHLSALGAPIAGDTLYGGAAELDGQAVARCLLHAWSLRFPWEGGTFEVTCPLPADLRRFFDDAGVEPGEER
jgi:23S rRNA pseudouridine1911/1915/1917 synthase